MLGYLNNQNVILFTNKTTTNKDFDALHKAVLYGISESMSAIFQKGIYGTINTQDTTTMGYYVVRLLS